MSQKGESEGGRERGPRGERKPDNPREQRKRGRKEFLTKIAPGERARGGKGANPLAGESRGERGGKGKEKYGGNPL